MEGGGGVHWNLCTCFLYVWHIYISLAVIDDVYCLILRCLFFFVFFVPFFISCYNRASEMCGSTSTRLCQWQRHGLSTTIFQTWVFNDMKCDIVCLTLTFELWPWKSIHLWRTSRRVTDMNLVVPVTLLHSLSCTIGFATCNMNDLDLSCDDFQKVYTYEERQKESLTWIW